MISLSNGKVQGQVCHIKAEKPDGPRYDASQSGEDRHGFNNLILLCSTHHTEIDTNPEEYTVEKLTEMKLNHDRSSAFKIEITDAAANEALDAVIARMKPTVAISSQNQSGGQIAQTIKNIVSISDQDDSIGLFQLPLLLKNLKEYKTKLNNFYEIASKLDLMKGNGKNDEIKDVETIFIKTKKNCIDSLEKVQPIYTRKTVAITGVGCAYYSLDNAISKVSKENLMLDKFRDHLDKADMAITAIASHFNGSTTIPIEPEFPTKTPREIQGKNSLEIDSYPPVNDWIKASIPVLRRLLEQFPLDLSFPEKEIPYWYVVVKKIQINNDSQWLPNHEVENRFDYRIYTNKYSDQVFFDNSPFSIENEKDDQEEYEKDKEMNFTDDNDLIYTESPLSTYSIPSGFQKMEVNYVMEAALNKELVRMYKDRIVSPPQGADK